MPGPADVPVLSGLHFWVADVAAAVRFFRAIGLEIPEAEGTFASATLANGIDIAFGSHALTKGYDPGFREPAGKGPVCLQVDLPSRPDVDAMHAKLTALGYASHLAPFDAFWGSRYAEVTGPDRIVAGFQSPRDGSLGGPAPGG
jgi:hypothetical protein